MNITFSNPEFLIYLLFIPLLFILFFAVFLLRRKRLSRFFSHKSLSRLRLKFSWKRKVISLFLVSTALVFMVLALSRPQSDTGNDVEKNEGIEVIILADVSRSMRVQDVLPSRLLLMKTELGRWLKTAKKNHRVGLIAFAGSAFLMSPLTSDLDLIGLYIDSLSTDMLSSQGTNLKQAFKKARRAFKEGGLAPVTKAVIIAGDGEDNETGALEEAKALSQEGIRIFSLGFGTGGGGLIPLEDGSGYLRDEGGREVRSQLKTHLLKEYAKIGKGAFYRVSAGSKTSEKIHQDLAELEQYVFEERKKKKRSDKFQYFLIFSFIFSLAYLLFKERR